MITLEDTINTLYQAGHISARLSASHVARPLRQRGLDLDSLTAPPPASSAWPPATSTPCGKSMPPVCVLYRAPGGELRLIEEGGALQNKPQNLVRVIDKLLTRFVAVEYASGCIAEVYAGGETTENLLDFLMWAFTQRHGADGTPMPFHGVPYMPYTDQGAMFKSAPRAQLFERHARAPALARPGQRPRHRQRRGSANIFERGFEKPPALH